MHSQRYDGPNTMSQAWHFPNVFVGACPWSKGVFHESTTTINRRLHVNSRKSFSAVPSTIEAQWISYISVHWDSYPSNSNCRSIRKSESSMAPTVSGNPQQLSYFALTCISTRCNILQMWGVENSKSYLLPVCDILWKAYHMIAYQDQYIHDLIRHHWLVETCFHK